ncbi:MAG TPA: MdtA/MuxA family multidrug efflux RND transporter periplasmic adaptor subunit [Burkholderiales bacterium]|jgi:multidrug efflux system membrane fusion protein|nr:MdtA/MuxA family multidrug efflux RND transporter periplasmic adaptor subunit [Burkholderiales bacterium]
MKRKALWALVVVVLVAAGAGAGWFIYQRIGEAKVKAATKTNYRGGGASVPVVAVAASTADIGVQLEGLGTVTPVATVTVRSRVDGQLVKIGFREGQVVKAGDFLAEIDPRPFQVALAQAEAQLARDAALLKNAQVDLERYRVLFKQDSIAQQQLATQEALVRQNEATLKMDQANVENARLQLAYSRITAPVSGRLGLRQVDLGNMVRAGDANGLVVITQLQPITVVFPIAEDSLPPVMKKLAAGEKLPVAAYDRAGKTQLASGTLITADNVIDPATGTVKLKAQFSNEDYGLFPSQFVNARMLVDTRKDATVVPTAAVQRGTPGTFVYAVDPEKKVVSVKKVRVGPQQGERVAIEEGISPGTLVVVDGTDRLREGATVELVVRDDSPPKDSPRKKGDQKLSVEERARRWQELNARIDRGDFGEEIRKLPEEERKKKMRELRDKAQK